MSDWLTQFKEMMLNSDVVSFDVFDTAISRRVEFPADVFALAESRLLVAIGKAAQGYARARELAESKVRASSWATSNQEIHIDEIYKALPSWLPSADPHGRDMLLAELQAERDVLFGVPTVQAAYRLATEAGKLVIFVSDTYLSEVQVAEFLRCCGYQDNHQLLISSATRMTKAAGGQWPLLQRRFPSARIMHVGDDAHADEAVPKTHGIETLAFTDFRSECRLGGPLVPAVLPFSFASRHAQLKTGGNRQPNNPASFIVQFGETWGAVVLGSFIKWLEEKITTLGIRHIFFCARDGWLLQRCWDAANASERTGVSGRYLQVSRRPLHLAAAAQPAANGLLSQQALEDLCYEGITPLLMLERAGLTNCVDLAAAVSRAVFGRLKTPVRRERVGKLRKLLARHSGAVLAALKPVKESVSGYIKQEFESINGRVAIVDIGWHGTLQISLAHLLRELNPTVDLHGFYYSLFPSAQPRRPFTGWMEGAFGNDFMPLNEQAGIQNAVAWLENLHLEQTGSTVGYCQEDERWIPIFQPRLAWQDHNSALISRFQESVVDSIRVMFSGEQFGLVQLSDLAVSAGRCAIERVALSPTVEEVNVLGSILHAADADHMKVRAIVGSKTPCPISARNSSILKEALSFGQTAWPVGTALGILRNATNPLERTTIVSIVSEAMPHLDPRTLRQFQ